MLEKRRMTGVCGKPFRNTHVIGHIKVHTYICTDFQLDMEHFAGQIDSSSGYARIKGNNAADKLAGTPVVECTVRMDRKAIVSAVLVNFLKQ